MAIDLTGKKSIDFYLKDSTDGEHCLRHYNGKWVLLVFHRHLG